MMICFGLRDGWHCFVWMDARVYWPCGIESWQDEADDALMSLARGWIIRLIANAHILVGIGKITSLHVHATSVDCHVKRIVISIQCIE